MKKLSTISLFIFGVVVMAILTAGLVFYQNNKNVTPTSSLVKNAIDKVNPNGGTVILNMTEIAKHNKSSNCWMIINNKVYNITSYFGSHPGGNSIMSSTCGTDATVAYATRDPYAKTSGSRISHSSKAQNMLDYYYLGDLNQSIGEQKISNINTVIVPSTKAGDYENDD